MFHYRIHNSLPLAPTLSETQRVFLLLLYFLRVCLSTILSFMLMSSKLFPSLRCPIQKSFTLIDVMQLYLYLGKGKGKVHPITGHEGP